MPIRINVKSALMYIAFAAACIFLNGAVPGVPLAVGLYFSMLICGGNMIASPLIYIAASAVHFSLTAFLCSLAEAAFLLAIVAVYRRTGKKIRFEAAVYAAMSLAPFITLSDWEAEALSFIGSGYAVRAIAAGVALIFFLFSYKSVYACIFRLGRCRLKEDELFCLAALYTCIGTGAINLAGQFAYCAFGAFGASDETWFVQDGVVDLAQAQPEWRTYVSWLNKLWEEGLLDQDSLSLDDTSIKAKVHNDQVGISITSMGQLTNWNNERVADGKEPVWAGIQYPTGDDGTLSMVFGGPGIGTQTGVITTSADEETMKLCLQMLDYAYTAEGFLYWNFGKEGVSWEYGEDGEPQYT